MVLGLKLLMHMFTILIRVGDHFSTDKKAREGGGERERERVSREIGQTVPNCKGTLNVSMPVSLL